MLYLPQFLIILGFSLLGEALQRLLPVPIPASVYGIVLLFAALCLKLIKVEQVKEASSFLVSILPPLFVPLVAGLMENWSLVRPALFPLLLLTVSSTILTFGISGSFTQRFLKKEDDHDPVL